MANLKLNKGCSHKRKAHKYAPGGILDFNGEESGLGWNEASKDTLKSSFSKDNLAGTASSLMGGISGIVGATKNNAQIKNTSYEESLIEDAANANMNNLNSLDALIQYELGMKSLKDDYTASDIRGISGKEMFGNTLGALGQGAMTGLQVGGPWGALAGGIIGLGSSIGGIIAGNAKADEQAQLLNLLAKDAARKRQNRFVDQVNEVMNKNYQNMMANFAAEGGPIHTHGGVFSNDIITINNGGSHSENPYEGVPMGIAPDGVPNLVEENEVIFNDYVFSDRLKVPKKELTFAEAAKRAQKESEERPNDSISKAGLEDSMNKLMYEQEMVRAKKGKRGENRLMAYGGRKFENGTPNLPTLDDIIIEEPIIDIEGNFTPLEYGEYVLPLFKSNGKRDDVSIKMGKDGKGRPISTPQINGNSSLRYAPAIATGIGSLISALQDPDYSNAKILEDEANNIPSPSISWTPITASYRPTLFDRNYYLTQARNQGAATREALMNSGANAGAVMAGLAAAEQATQKGIGEGLRQGALQNAEERARAYQFEAAKQQANATGDLQAQRATADILLNRAKLRSSLLGSAVGLRESTDTALSESRSSNLSNLAQNIGDIGRENVIWEMINSNPALFYELSRDGRLGYKSSNGGMLTKKSRKRRR